MVTPINIAISRLRREMVTELLQLIVDRKIGDPFNEGRPLTVRGLARYTGFNESTLRTAFRTPDRAPSQRTLDRLDQALQNVTPSFFVQRRERKGLVTDDISPLGPAFVRIMPPPNARRYKLVIRTPNGPYPYSTITPDADVTDLGPDDFDYWRNQGTPVVRVHWDVG
jgi:hypothetical protein